MADMPDPDTGDENSRPDRRSGVDTPRWVKLFGVIALVVLIVFVALLLSGRGHGPGRHTGAGSGEEPHSGHVETS